MYKRQGQTLIDSLDYQPLLVKPNNHELGAIFGVKLESLDEIENYARQLLAKGAQNVIISMAGDGALLVTSEGAYFAKPIKLSLIHILSGSVCCNGDEGWFRQGRYHFYRP